MSIEVGALVSGFQLLCIPLYTGRGLILAGSTLRPKAAPPESPLALPNRLSGAARCVDEPRLTGRLMGGCIGGVELAERPSFIIWGCGPYEGGGALLCDKRW